jgi:DNA-binding beta-propeller fold protein YncE
MAFGPDGNFYVAQADKDVSAILQFNGALASGSYTMTFLADFVTATSSPGLVHPYEPIFGPDGNLYVSSQDSNIVSAFYGPSNAGKSMPAWSLLPGTFYPGTFVPAFSAKVGIPPNTSVPVNQGGLTFVTTSSSTHSVRGLAFDNSGNLYVADEGNNRVSVFSPAGTFLGAITQSKNHTISEPVALCFDAASGTLYIASPGNESLFTYDVSGVAKKDFSANFLFTNSQLDKLSGIALDLSGNIYTANRKDNTIEKWTASGSSWSSSPFAGPFGDSPERIIPVYTPLSGA